MREKEIKKKADKPGRVADNKKSRANGRGKLIPKVLIGIIGALAVIYLGFSIYFMNHFPFRSMIGDTNVSMMSADRVKEVLAEESKKYVLTITGRNDLQGTISKLDIDLQLDFGEEIERLIASRSGFSWPISLFGQNEYSPQSAVSFSEEHLRDQLKKLPFYDKTQVTAPEDATYRIGENGFEVVPEKEGTTLDDEKTYEAVASAVEALSSTLSLEEAGCYAEPAVRSTDETLLALVDNLNAYAGVKITFSFGDATEVLDANVIQEWLTIETDGKTVSFEEDKVKEYVNTLARTYDTFGKSREFQTTGGRTITVSGGDYGWWMDRKTTTANIIEAIKNRQSGSMEPVYFGKAVQYGADDIGNSYVEVDLDNQHVYVYKDGVLEVSSDCVSGKAIAGNGTPNGTYAITYKEKDATLVGEGYSSPVKYWMPFNGNIGLHDASWRSQFGGSIYVTGGSHGCINLPSSKAEKIFEVVEKGEPVIVYGGKNKEQAKATKEENTTEEQSEPEVTEPVVNPDGTITQPDGTVTNADGTPIVADAPAAEVDGAEAPAEDGGASDSGEAASAAEATPEGDAVTEPVAQ